MADDALPPHVRRLILDDIESVGQLELLLLLHKDPSKEWRAGPAARELHTDPGWALSQLELLASREILQTTGGPDPGFRFRPSTPELENAVNGLARAYAERRVSIVNMIGSKPDSRIQIFADAFRIRKDR